MRCNFFAIFPTYPPVRSLLLPLLLLCSLAMTAADPVKQTFRAKRAENDLKIDGVLDEAAWHHEHAQTAHFIATSPVAGKVSDQATFVSVLYDDYAVYIGVKLFDKPENIKRELGLRDDFDRNSDWFSVMFDTYDKQQNAFAFGVTAAGVQGDALASADGMDGAWNAVWKSAVKMAADGWVAEFQIPYAALRFPKQDVQVWGINFGRYLRNTQEETYWNYINPNVNGTVTQFGKLEGISAIKPPLRLQLYPFLSGYANKEKGQPITPAFGYGADLKFGLNEAYTVDMSLVPDFRQTISDQKVLNLGPFEVQFQENRQFFTEGTELFNRGGIFYSRRIGETQRLQTQPKGIHDSVTFAPETAPIYNITKLSGRGKNGLGVGLLNAVTGPTYYTVLDTTDETGQTRELMADPFTNYNIFVVDKNIKHNSNWSFVTSNVNRGEHMGGENVALGRVSLFDKTNTWNPGAAFHLSNSWRPDSTGKMVNTPGYKYSVNFNKVSGNFQFYLMRNVESNTYTHNALGYLQAPNEVSHFVSLAYYRNKPFMKGLFNNGKIFFNPFHTQLHTPRVYSEGGYSLNANAQFKNFWGIWVEHWHGMAQDDYFEARTPGYFFSSPGSSSFSLGASTDARQKLYAEVDAGFWSRPSWNQWDNWCSATLRMRISNQFSLSHETSWNRRRRERGFAGQLLNEKEDSVTNVIIGERYVNTMTNTLSGQWTFNPYMGLNLRVRHYWSHVDVINTFDLDTTGQIHAIDLTGKLPDDGVPTTYYDRNYNVFNVDLQYSWQFAPGSFMNVVWKNVIETRSLDAGETYSENLHYLLQQGGTNSLSVRMIFFLDYQAVARRLG